MYIYNIHTPLSLSIYIYVYVNIYISEVVPPQTLLAPSSFRCVAQGLIH